MYLTDHKCTLEIGEPKNIYDDEVNFSYVFSRPHCSKMTRARQTVCFCRFVFLFVAKLLFLWLSDSPTILCNCQSVPTAYVTILDFTGVDSISMCLEDCTWLENIDIDLYPWDAGTDSGECCYRNRILIINLCLWSAKNWEKLFLINQNWPNSSWIVQTDKNMWCSCHLMIHTSKTLSNC